ncbi:aminoglycoside phosphotransferase family protein [Geomicrobium sp. JCM 19037]|uniref:aminoglycoside phosphotransferase family protein n=1 Tax=Geomicrobium sp. JCM 19037 TaxID=1460634 RepID=UPI0009DD1E23|nr:aminoglycoside phosphotransferase family protein [Geomicrobium sp. JCM 19037]
METEVCLLQQTIEGCGMEIKSLISAFGLNETHSRESLYAYAPVYRVGEYVIKKTQSPLTNAKRLMQFTTSLKEAGVRIVTPALLSSPNPIQVGDDCFVVYPFIKGDAYTGTRKQIREAGKLLGQIHQQSEGQNMWKLPVYDVFDFYHHEVKESMAKIREHAIRAQSLIPLDQLEQTFAAAVDAQDELGNAPLKYVLTPHDYKANNLLYTDSSPVLIDPDNAGYVPAIFDLALVLLLFHNEMASALIVHLLRMNGRRLWKGTMNTTK